MTSRSWTAAPSRESSELAGPAMSACACTGRTFEEVSHRMDRDGLTLSEAESLTGCGSICTACIPDLRSFLGRRMRTVSKE